MGEVRGAPRVRWLVAGTAAATVSATFALLWVAAAATAAPTCNVTVNSENNANNSIQTAINAANPGWTVCIGAGTFPEQVTISKSINLVGAGASSTILKPTALTTNARDWDNAPAVSPIDVVLLVNNSSAVHISKLTVDGSAALTSISSCAVGIVGIDFQNSTGSVVNSVVRSVEKSPADLGCQEQLGIYAYTGFFATHFVPGSPMTVTVSGTTVSAYGKNGITCDDPGLTCVLKSDTTVGIGPTTAIAQNGIQIGFGTVGQLSHDHVLANNFTGATATNDWYGNGFQSAGILLYLAANGTFVRGCAVSDSAMGIAVFGNGTNYITGNTVTNSVAYGIVENEVPGAHAFVGNNTVTNPGTGGVGILVDNGSFNLTHNKIAHVSSSGTNGASQVVCGTGAFLACSPTRSVTTAAIQAVSESGVGATSLVLFDNSYSFDSLHLATLAVLGGSVSVAFVS